MQFGHSEIFHFVRPNSSSVMVTHLHVVLVQYCFQRRWCNHEDTIALAVAPVLHKGLSKPVASTGKSEDEIPTGGKWVVRTHFGVCLERSKLDAFVVALAQAIILSLSTGY